MNEILNKVQKDLSKLQKTIEAEGEILLGKLMSAANKATSNKNVVAKRKEIEKLIEKQVARLEPAFEKFYKEAKATAGKYGVNIEKIEKKVRSKVKTKAKSTKADAAKVKKTTSKAPPASSTKSAVGGAKKAKKKTTKKA
ncbi:MAG: hypothetical protein H7318_10530 [Oligoflexus sp.]|nr:hypothetical protein [Oligoflexus sp.]